MNILLHICCSNCATYPFKILKEEKHNLTGFWFNPNIHPFEEYSLRLDSLKALEGRWLMDMYYAEEYSPDEYFSMFDMNALDVQDVISGDSGIKGNLKSPQRCKACYRLRLDKTAEEAGKRGFEAFSTTLLISPYQDFDQIITQGRELAGKYGTNFFYKDFRPLFRDSLVLSRELGLYRQKYCGCLFSRAEREKR
jgi:predicted adenine nucleotide alpha hydrolase (AANH) superfamily ATPase